MKRHADIVARHISDAKFSIFNNIVKSLKTKSKYFKHIISCQPIKNALEPIRNFKNVFRFCHNNFKLILTHQDPKILFSQSEMQHEIVGDVPSACGEGTGEEHVRVADKRCQQRCLTSSSNESGFFALFFIFDR